MSDPKKFSAADVQGVFQKQAAHYPGRAEMSDSLSKVISDINEYVAESIEAGCFDENVRRARIRIDRIQDAYLIDILNHTPERRDILELAKRLDIAISIFEVGDRMVSSKKDLMFVFHFGPGPHQRYATSKFPKEMLVEPEFDPANVRPAEQKSFVTLTTPSQSQPRLDETRPMGAGNAPIRRIWEA